MRKPAHHVVVNLVLARLECRHCGGSLGLALPMEIRALARLGKAFEANHRGCVPPPGEVAP